MQPPSDCSDGHRPRRGLVSQHHGRPTWRARGTPNTHARKRSAHVGVLHGGRAVGNPKLCTHPVSSRVANASVGLRSVLTSASREFKMNHRAIALAASAIASLPAALIASAPASARPYEAPRISQYSQDIWSVGSNSGCRGAIHVGIKVDPQQRGTAFITLTPRPFVGDGPAWHRNPVCTIRTGVAVDLVRKDPRWERTITAGPRGGKRVHVTVKSGSGPHVITVGGTGTSLGSSNWMVVP